MTDFPVERPRRIEDAPSGLAYVMRRHGAVFYHERGGEYIIHVPRRTGGGRPDHRVYEAWRISGEKIELMSANLDHGMPPMNFDAEPPRGPGRRSGRRKYQRR